MRAAAVLMVLALAGCLGSSPEEAPTRDVPPDAGLVPENATAAIDAQPVLVALDFAGRFTRGAQVCSQTGCTGQGVFDGETERTFAGLTGTITATSLRIEWTSTTPGTQRLGAGIMTMYRDCDSCEPVEYGSAVGPSPLVIDLTGLRVPIDERGMLHVYVYPLSAADAAGYVVASDDQPFTVIGSARVAPPAATD